MCLINKPQMVTCCYFACVQTRPVLSAKWTQKILAWWDVFCSWNCCGMCEIWCTIAVALKRIVLEGGLYSDLHAEIQLIKFTLWIWTMSMSQEMLTIWGCRRTENPAYWYMLLDLFYCRGECHSAVLQRDPFVYQLWDQTCQMSFAVAALAYGLFCHKLILVTFYLDDGIKLGVSSVSSSTTWVSFKSTASLRINVAVAKGK